MFNLKTITFDQIKTSSIALEFDELIPDEIYSWTEADFAKYQVPIGNSRFPLSDFFKVTVEGDAAGPNEVEMILNGDLNRVKY
ncbi:MAG: formylmethanofuran dehydrogenase subunit C, partial [Methanobrevibacter sp.]|nr:formylmethanofuran dehydrogenase subunit C [Methanobrevibacter sp.]